MVTDWISEFIDYSDIPKNVFVNTLEELGQIIDEKRRLKLQIMMEIILYRHSLKKSPMSVETTNIYRDLLKKARKYLGKTRNTKNDLEGVYFFKLVRFLGCNAAIKHATNSRDDWLGPSQINFHDESFDLDDFNIEHNFFRVLARKRHDSQWSIEYEKSMALLTRGSELDHVITNSEKNNAKHSFIISVIIMRLKEEARDNLYNDPYTRTYSELKEKSIKFGKTYWQRSQIRVLELVCEYSQPRESYNLLARKNYTEEQRNDFLEELKFFKGQEIGENVTELINETIKWFSA